MCTEKFFQNQFQILSEMKEDALKLANGCLSSTAPPTLRKNAEVYAFLRYQPKRTTQRIWATVINFRQPTRLHFDHQLERRCYVGSQGDTPWHKRSN